MLTQEEKDQIISQVENHHELSVELREKAIAHLISGGVIFGNAGDYLCCDTGLSAPNRFQWITFDDCKKIYNGSPADNSQCGR